MHELFHQSFPVRYHELDSKGNLKPLALLHCIQDAAGMHARQLGVSVTDLHGLGLTWVLSRLHVVIRRWQRAEESVLVCTWPSSRKSVFTCREFEISDGKGAITAMATSSWAVVKLETHRPVRLEGNLPAYPLLAERALEDRFDSLPPLPPGPCGSEAVFRVQRSDLDINNHVNNAVYAGWALEAAPEDVAKARLSELEISYRAEALYGETVISRCSVGESVSGYDCLHQIVNAKDNRELSRLRSRWQRL